MSIMMMRGVMAAALCVLFLALVQRGETARLGGTRALSLAEESKVALAQARYEAGDSSCGRSGYHYRCFDTPTAAHTGTTTTGTTIVGNEWMYSSELVAKARALNGDTSCGRIGYQWRCFDTPSSGDNLATTEETTQGDLPDRSDCGPLGSHRYRCGDIPPATTEETTPRGEDSPVVVGNRPYPSDCGPLGKHKYRCVPPHRKL